ncbi:MAG TPA: transglycosylase SLT domain-containing protein [Ktedonobacterales bacterium]|nr:transglycosylase SLT domain-containing protein [Ktedonobacterales bacterium]
MHRVSQYVRNAASNLHGAHKAVIAVGALAATFAGAAVTAPVQAHGANLSFHRGYKVEGSWLCYGWSNGAYHCTQHWHRSGGALVSDNPAWVPNYGASTVSHSTATTTKKSATVKKATHITRSAPVHKTTPYVGASNPGQQAVINEIRAVFGPYSAGALNIARCESGFNPSAYNRTPVAGAHAAGVFQILDTSTWRTTSYAGQSPYNAYANIHAAYQIFQRDGYSWREWQCRP